MPKTKAKDQPVTIEHRGSMLTYKNKEGDDQCLGYLLVSPEHGIFDATVGKVDVTAEEADTHNRLLDEALIRGLDETCEVGQHGMFYRSKDEQGRIEVRTWLGTHVAYASRRGVSQFQFTRKGRTFQGRVRRGDDLLPFKRIS